MTPETVLIVGCGVSGLTCAVQLLEVGRPVKIRARDLPPDTTSDVAAAFWYPYRAYPLDRVNRWARTSFERFRDLATEAATGVVMRPAIEVFRRAAPESPSRGAVPERSPGSWRQADFRSPL